MKSVIACLCALSILLSSPVHAEDSPAEDVASLYQSVGNKCLQDAEAAEICSCQFVQELARLMRQESLPEFGWRAAVDLRASRVVGGQWTLRTRVRSKYGAIRSIIHYGNSAGPCLEGNDPRGYIAAVRAAVLKMKEVDRVIEDTFGQQTV